MDHDFETLGDVGSEDTELVNRGKLSCLLGMEIPVIGLESEATFEALLRALNSRRDRQRRRRLLIACSVGAATAIVGTITMVLLLPR